MMQTEQPPEIIVKGNTAYMVMQKLGNCSDLVVPILMKDAGPITYGMWESSLFEYTDIPRQKIKWLIDRKGIRLSCTHNICKHNMTRPHVRCFRCRLKRVANGSLPEIHPIRVWSVMEIDMPRFRKIRRFIIKQLFRFIGEPISNA